MSHKRVSKSRKPYKKKKSTTQTITKSQIIQPISKEKFRRKIWIAIKASGIPRTTSTSTRVRGASHTSYGVYVDKYESGSHPFFYIAFRTKSRWSSDAQDRKNDRKRILQDKRRLIKELDNLGIVHDGSVYVKDLGDQISIDYGKNKVVH